MQEQDRANDQVDAALNLFCDRGLGFNARDKNREALMMVLKEALNDQYDYIDWWFCEAAPDYMVWSEDGEKELAYPVNYLYGKMSLDKNGLVTRFEQFYTP